MKPRNTTTLLSALACALMAMGAVSAETPKGTPGTPFETHIYSEALMIEPAADEAFDVPVDLIIKGPNDFLLQEHYPAGTLIELGSHSLPDGKYNFEVRPAGAGKTRNAGQQVAEAPTPTFSSHSGVFTITNGEFVSPDTVEAPTVAPGNEKRTASSTQAADTGDGELLDQVIVDDLIVQRSACIGFDCVNGENFGFDTIRLKENNLRIKFDDTSTSGSFPNTDWQLTANDSANGGANKFSIDDTTNSRTPFTIEANAPSHSLYVDDTGRIGMGTSTPVVEAHVVDGDSPTLRLQQDTSSGFQAQTWDIAGNETNFFVRDTTNGSKLPFRIFPNSASSSLVVRDGNVGVGTTSPDAPFEVASTNAFNFFRISADGASPNTAVDLTFTDAGADGELRINIVDGDGKELSLDADGNLVINGTLTANGSTFPDYVFAEDYRLMPLKEVKNFITKNRHLPNVPSAEEVASNGLNMTDMQKKLMEKVEELTLYTIEQQETIDRLTARLDELEANK